MTRLAIPSTPKKGFSNTLTAGSPPMLVPPGMKQLKDKEIGHDVNRYRRVAELIQEVSNSVLGAHRQRNQNRVDFSPFGEFNQFA